MPGQVKESDYDEFLECPTCRNVVPLYNQMQLQFIDAFADLSDSPFEDGKGQVYCVPARNTEEDKRDLAKKRRKRQGPLHQDKEVNELLRKYRDNVKIHSESGYN